MTNSCFFVAYNQILNIKIRIFAERFYSNKLYFIDTKDYEQFK